MTNILLLLIVLELAVLIWRGRAVQPSKMPYLPAPPGEVELLALSGGAWQFHSFRPEGHPDIAEALATPGMAIRRGGVIEEGKQ